MATPVRQTASLSNGSMIRWIRIIMPYEENIGILKNVRTILSVVCPFLLFNLNVVYHNRVVVGDVVGSLRSPGQILD